MLTTKKVLLTSAPWTVPFIRYEAIEVINSEDQIGEVHSSNKTPFMVSTNVNSMTRKHYQVLDVPQDIFPRPNVFIDYCHRNGIECGEPLSKEKYDTNKEECFLCDIAKYCGKASAEEHNRTTKTESDLIIYESEHFFVKIELGCMVKGMLMIMPKEHILSVAAIPDDQFEEYYQVMKDMEFLLKAIYGFDKPVIFFEHGSAPDGVSSHKRSVVHAHTHLAWGVEFPDEYLDAVCVHKVRNEKVLRGTKYFSYQCGTKGQLMAVNDPAVYVQRQYPRQVIAHLMGIPNEMSNWRVEPFTENMHNTFEDIYAFLKSNGQFLNGNLVSRTECFVRGYEQR